MTPEQKHRDKVIVYILLGIIAAVLIALYVYGQLKLMSEQPAYTGPVTEQLSPAELEKQRLLADLASSSQTTDSTSPAQKSVLLKSLAGGSKASATASSSGEKAGLLQALASSTASAQ